MLFAVLELIDFCVIAAIVMVFAGGAAAHTFFRPSDAARLRRLEWKVDHLLRHLNIQVPDPMTSAGLSEAVRRLADDPATKIQAIRLHREQTGLGLKAAKDAVEAYCADR